MTEAAKPSDEGGHASERHPANQRRTPFEVVPEPAPLEAGTRIESSDYGQGTVVAFVAIGIQVYWDRALVGTVDGHILTHDASYLELRCRRL